MQVAFLGIGLMGQPMAKRLLNAGLALKAWSRTAAKAESLVAIGAIAAPTPAKAVATADVTITMLENGSVVEQVLMSDSMLRALRPGSLVIDMSSIAPEQANDHARRLGSIGVRYIDAPVSGGTGGAEAGTLAIMAGGDVNDIESASSIWPALGRVTHVGPHGCGQLVKLANQMIVGMSIGAVAEALYLVERCGGDPEKAIAAMAGGFADSKILSLHGARMAQRDFEKRATMRVQLKDLDNALTAAAILELPITQLVRALYGSAVAQGDADLDHSAVWREIDRINNGGVNRTD
jgi:3-hydroxyisobutyrate dehydrogenase-like beta-hydroxyacid dehydrogenase